MSLETLRANDPAAANEWYVVARPEDVRAHSAARLLGHDITLAREGEGVTATGPAGEVLPVRLAYGHVWTSPGTPPDALFPIDEFGEDDRKLATCGAVRVRASGLRLVENFLDMAHFPFVHTGILGAVERPEVERYECAVRNDEVWATNCRFFQPQAAAHAADGGQMSDYTYRVAAPFNVLLYKTSPSDPARLDVIGLFVQPVEPDVSLAWAFVLVIDEASTTTDLIAFQQTIFLQDRVILENQRPRLLPLVPGAEIPTRADMASVAYRRWLKEKGLRFGVHEHRADDRAEAA